MLYELTIDQANIMKELFSECDANGDGEAFHDDNV
jgi:hypothetical protein